jgi:organic radical activating enzyme
MKELTIEITNYCPHNCKYCSSNAVDNPKNATYLALVDIAEYLNGKRFDRINISGGEPMAHPEFYNIFILCQEYCDDVVVYSNLITHLRYNQNVIDGVYLEANVTILPEVDKVHILRRVKQGREARRPEVHFSRNFSEDCECDHHILRPDGTLTKTPCNKWSLLK